MTKIVAKKKFGQNFLIDENIKNKIVASANISTDDVVVEIGPGTGAITKMMLPKAKKVISYEVDTQLVELLKTQIKAENFELVEGDFLKQNLPNYKYKVVANIPYNITSDILFKLFKNHKNIDTAIIMMQKDVADRILAKFGSSNYSKLSATTMLFTDVKKLFDVSPSSFSPAPMVTSSVMEFRFKNEVHKNAFAIVKFIALCFQFRRKFLTKNLENTYGKEQVIQLLKELDLPLTCRAQELSLQTFILLFEGLNK
ncbi:dimethyladenosine transferase [Mycoplasmopsis californica]|uniref:Ribosomal RNA small subunit methyltransferase A n=1 Tax=Mycoplasmopsis equigenitalium TaxID=114883 RepID=A0ABY5J5B1_9BACT|nr:16S rRNA (adenine(1518)-N(6)/adenine(1519)-N(6))-dimethyltransferase RsmA [Mycoplasmopsis equigenitalium]UUD37071.1 16S rRNA (adenine(1518)-N(6)/adenine(1519)-N(6))-dimethyltransferase RsmA [Mycoplasmopsis equigenitalium]VEU69628.1 dimethyladenosine transferase [Mycoplasmopsis californica]